MIDTDTNPDKGKQGGNNDELEDEDDEFLEEETYYTKKKVLWFLYLLIFEAICLFVNFAGECAECAKHTTFRVRCGFELKYESHKIKLSYF